jgi:hypothetical protein
MLLAPAHRHFLQSSTGGRPALYHEIVPLQGQRVHTVDVDEALLADSERMTMLDRTHEVRARGDKVERAQCSDRQGGRQNPPRTLRRGHGPSCEPAG